MKEIVIIGAGGLGKEIYSYIQDDISEGFLKNVYIKGFLDDNEDSFHTLNLKEVHWLGKVDDYIYKKNDFVVVAISNISIRNKIINQLERVGVNFFTFIHSSVYISMNSSIGKGCIICPNSIIQFNSQIGDYSILNIFVSIGHDSGIGKGCVLSPYATLNGNVTTGDNLFMGTRSTILLGSSIGNNCTISAHTVVRGDIGDNLMIKDKIDQIQVKNRLV